MSEIETIGARVYLRDDPVEPALVGTVVGLDPEVHEVEVAWGDLPDELGRFPVAELVFVAAAATPVPGEAENMGSSKRGLEQDLMAAGRAYLRDPEANREEFRALIHEAILHRTFVPDVISFITGVPALDIEALNDGRI